MFDQSVEFSAPPGFENNTAPNQTHVSQNTQNVEPNLRVPETQRGCSTDDDQNVELDLRVAETQWGCFVNKGQDHDGKKAEESMEKEEMIDALIKTRKGTKKEGTRRRV